MGIATPRYELLYSFLKEDSIGILHKWLVKKLRITNNISHIFQYIVFLNNNRYYMLCMQVYEFLRFDRMPHGMEYAFFEKQIALSRYVNAFGLHFDYLKLLW